MPITVGNTTITFNDATTMSTAATGTVSSVATGNGLQGGTITTTGTLSVACPAFNSVGSYAYVITQGANGQNYTMTSGSNYSAGTGSAQLQSLVNDPNTGGTNNLSGTWKWMGGTLTDGNQKWAIACRVS